MASDHHHDDNDLHDRGLAFDLQTLRLMGRRHALKLFAGTAAIAAVGCSNDGGGEPAATSSSSGGAANGANAGGTQTAAVSSTAGSGAAAAPATPVLTTTPIPTSPTPLSACTALPTETAGPFPGDGSNGPNVLTQSGIVRSDMRSSFGTSNTVAGGVPLDYRLTVVDTKNGCRPMPGAAVYLWTCDREGRYSMYTAGVTNENYLRAVQVADANGVVTFRSIFPGTYSGRWPHAHFEVYENLAAASSSRNARATSQLALPEDVCRAVYATDSGYSQSIPNLDRLTLATDNIFRDGWALQLASMTGNTAAGYVASLLVGV